MLKKSVVADIVPSHRICTKCGATTSVNPIEDKTYCNKCGEIVHFADENTENIPIELPNNDDA